MKATFTSLLGLPPPPQGKPFHSHPKREASLQLLHPAKEECESLSKADTASSTGCRATVGERLVAGAVMNERESNLCEFKNYSDVLGAYHLEAIFKAVCAFANCQGGDLYLGVSDLGTVHGMLLYHRTMDKLIARIEGGLASQFRPPLTAHVRIVIHPILNKKDSFVLRLTTRRALLPFRLVCYNKDCYMRRLASSIKLTGKEIVDVLTHEHARNLELVAALCQETVRVADCEEGEREAVKELLDGLLRIVK